MYSIRRTNSKNKLSNFVNGVSQEKFIVFLSFLFIGVSVFVMTPPLIKNHNRTKAAIQTRGCVASHQEGV